MSDWKDARMVQPEEVGTLAKCMHPDCLKMTRITFKTEVQTDNGWSATVDLSCGHRQTYNIRSLS